MKKFKAILCLLIVLLFIVACTNNGTSNDNQNAIQTPAPAHPGNNTPSTDESTGYDSINWDEHVSFTWWLGIPPNDYYTSYSNNPVNKYLENRFNITIEFEHPPVGTGPDAFSIMMGTGQLTDIFSLDSYVGSIPQLYEDGIIIDIAKWLDYMPNLQNLINSDPVLARGIFDDDGRILALPGINDDTVYPWSGFVYRHDIIEMMTGGNVQFPSGNDAPTTLDDWEYMLPLFLQYFEMIGFADFAPFILPSSGIFWFGDLESSFGSYHGLYVRDDIVHMGILEPNFFNYVNTMREWFEAGWIHQDYASRVGDMFFMPNPPLVFGGAAGSFFGMMMHLGDRLSMPEHGLIVDIRPMSSPLAPGVTHQDMIRRSEGRFGLGAGHAVYTGNPDIGRFLAVMDLFYSDEGGLLRTIGVREDQIASDDTVMSAIGLSDGAYFFDSNEKVILNPNLDEADRATINGIRFPGIQAISHINAVRTPEELHAHSLWGVQDATTHVHPLPPVLTPTEEESIILANNNARIDDIRDQMLMLFIIGTTQLNENTWNDFLNQLKASGIEENLAIWQAAYARYLARG